MTEILAAPADPELELTAAEQQALRDTEVILDENSQEFVDQLVAKLVRIADDISELPFRPYQRPVAARIIESIIIGDGARITALASRQSGKSTTIGAAIAVCMLMLPRLAKIYPNMRSLQKFRRGLYVGAFAPVDEQAGIIFAKISDVFQTEACRRIMADPEIGERAVVRGRVTLLKNCGSFVKRTTCHPKATIEGSTYHVIIIDEAQGGDNKAVNKSVVPMGTATRATYIFTGTPWYTTNFFYSQIQKNRRIQVRRGRKRQNHFQWDWKEVAKYVPEYKLTVQDAMLAMGENSDEFRMSYKCVAPGTQLLTADLRYVYAGHVQIGDVLAGFDEDRGSKGAHRNFRRSVVTGVERIIRPSYRLIMEDGTVIMCSAEHRWLVTTAGCRTMWKATEDLAGDDRIFKVASTVPPVRLLPKFDLDKLGSIGRHDKRSGGNGFAHPRVVSRHFMGDQEVMAIQTSTHTFIAEGLASHNCEWLTDKGMYVTEEILSDMCDISQQELIRTWTASPVIAGIDCARIQDRTVVTVLAVDWNHPDSEGFCSMYILNWLDLENMPWEQQYFRITEFLGNYHVFRCGVDTGGVGDVVIDRLRNLMPHIDFIDCKDSSQEQSDRWKYLGQIIDRRKLSWPYGAKIRERRVVRRFMTEMADLRKEFRGPYMKVAAPREADAHDDYPDSLAIAAWMARPEQQKDSTVTVTDNIFYNRSRSHGHKSRSHTRQRQFQPLQ